MTKEAAFLFDLDGTLVDSVYQHVLSWRDSLEENEMEISVWRIHRRMGMSGGLFSNALLRETGQPITERDANRLQDAKERAFKRYEGQVRPLPGARDLLTHLTATGVPWAVATSGLRSGAMALLELIGVSGEDAVIVTRDDVEQAKPDPDLFLEAARRLGIDVTSTIVVGDSVWDLLAARRAQALGVGVLSGGYGREELERAGAYRVYEDPAELLEHIDEVGVRGPSL